MFAAHSAGLGRMKASFPPIAPRNESGAVVVVGMYYEASCIRVTRRIGLNARGWAGMIDWKAHGRRRARKDCVRVFRLVFSARRSILYLRTEIPSPYWALRSAIRMSVSLELETNS